MDKRLGYDEMEQLLLISEKIYDKTEDEELKELIKEYTTTICLLVSKVAQVAAAGYNSNLFSWIG